MLEFIIFAAGSTANHTFYLNQRSHRLNGGTVSAWVQEVSNGQTTRFYLNSECGTATVSIFNTFDYNGKRWIIRKGSRNIDLYLEGNNHYAVLRQELCHYQKEENGRQKS